MEIIRRFINARQTVNAMHEESRQQACAITDLQERLRHTAAQIHSLQAWAHDLRESPADRSYRLSLISEGWY